VNIWFSKLFWLMMIDSALTGVDYVEAFEEGIVEDYIDEPYEIDDDCIKHIINGIITKER